MAVELVKIMGIPAGVVINRYLKENDNQTIEDYCLDEGLPVLLKIPLLGNWPPVMPAGNWR